MIPHIAPARQHASKTSNAFGDLVSYIEENKGQEHKLESPEASRILNYITNPFDTLTSKDKCIGIRTRNLQSIEGAATEMNDVAKRSRCPDPAYHFILSWPEHERPEAEKVYDAAEHALKSLGLAQHQAVIAIHANTDNLHCHIAVNRVHPQTFLSQHIEWAKKTLHYAARESELKHGWTHDNGIYIVQTDGKKNKRIVLNKDFGDNIQKAIPHAHANFEHETALPAWQDPESLEYWLKNNVSRALKKALPQMRGWTDLHAWFADIGITLTDTGGGGMRLTAISPDTEEVLTLPASKGIRFLKRADLESKWGQFGNDSPAPTPWPGIPPEQDAEITTGEITTPLKTITPSFEGLTDKQIKNGANHVLGLAQTLGRPGKPGKNAGTPGRLAQHLLYTQFDPPIDVAARASCLHELSSSSMDGPGQDDEMLLPSNPRPHLGIGESRQDPDLRRPGAGTLGSRSLRSLSRDDSKRDERKQQRAAARADLRQRYEQYKRFARQESPNYRKELASLKSERAKTRREALQEAHKAKREASKQFGTATTEYVAAVIEIDKRAIRRKLEAENTYQTKLAARKAAHPKALAWKDWLYEQSNLGDQAAISALRGIVYQAQRDAKNRAKRDEEHLPAPGRTSSDPLEEQEEKEARTEAERQRQYRLLMERLLEEERQEIAIRSVKRNAMRPYEVEALLVRYSGIQWHVTGNGNIAYSDKAGAHLFTDRGNRLTFDRQKVSDQEIQLALLHAQQKFGNSLTLTGTDPEFTARMAKLADDMGMKILNPEMQAVIAEHRKSKIAKPKEPTPARQEDTKPSKPERKPEKPPEPNIVHLALQNPADPALEIAENPVLPEILPTVSEETKSADERLRAKVLSIDPHAQFEYPNTSDEYHTHAGPVIANIDNANRLIAQYVGRGVYMIHELEKTAEIATETHLSIKYREGKPIVREITKDKTKGRAD